MSFCDIENLKIGEQYKLTETVENHVIGSKNYFLVSIQENKKSNYPVLGFAETRDGEADIFLTEAHAQFGEPTWRRSFECHNYWEIYKPIGSRTWNWSHVTVEKLEQVKAVH